MTELFTKPFADAVKSVQYAQLPEQVQVLVEEGLARSRELALQSITVAKNGVETLNKTSGVAPAALGELTATAFEHAIENTEAAFAAAKGIARAKSPLEAAQLQGSYLQAQLAKSTAQGQHLVELWSKLAQQSFAALKA